MRGTLTGRPPATLFSQNPAFSLCPSLPKTGCMRQFPIWAVVILIAQAIGGRCAFAELTLPEVTIKGETYTNVVVSPSTGERVMVRHSAGLGTVRIEDLSFEVRRHLAEEGIITGRAAKEILAPKKKASRWGMKSATPAGEAGEQNTGGEEVSLG